MVRYFLVLFLATSVGLFSNAGTALGDHQFLEGSVLPFNLLTDRMCTDRASQ